MRPSVRITLVQFTEKPEPDSVLQRMPAFFEQAAAFGADLVVFPEYCLGRRITLEDRPVTGFLELARRHKVYAVAGLIESIGPRWATTALLAGRDGKLVGKYLKCHPAAGIEPYCWPPVDGQDAEARGILGDGFPVFDLDFGRVGILQCYDGYLPEAWGCASYAGAEVILWINGRTSMVQDSFALTAAHCYACVVGATVSDGYNTGFAAPGSPAVPSAGIAPGMAPGSNPYLTAEGVRQESRLFPRLAQPGDAAVSATIHLDVLRKLRKHHRMAHQRRPELYGALTKDATIWR